MCSSDAFRSTDEELLFNNQNAYEQWDTSGFFMAHKQATLNWLPEKFNKS
jgi:hypothetical protein